MAQINEILSKSEIQFWIAIITIAVGFTVMFTRLEGRVSANEDIMFTTDSRIEDKLDYLIKTSSETNITVAEILIDLGHLREELNGR